MKLEDVMTRPATCTPDAPLPDVAQCLVSQADDVLPVVAASGTDEPLGLILGTDLIRCVVLSEGAYHRTAADVMCRQPVTVDVRTPIEEALAVLDRHRLSHLLVVDGSGAYVGIVDETTIRKMARRTV